MTDTVVHIQTCKESIFHTHTYTHTHTLCKTRYALQDTLCARHIVGACAFNGLLDGDRERLEGRLGPEELQVSIVWALCSLRHQERERESMEIGDLLVVIVLALEDIDVEGDARGSGKREQDVGNHLARQLADLLASQAEIDVGVRAARDIDHGAGQRLIQRAEGRAEPADTARRAERLLEGHAQRDTGVFRRVMIVNVEIALALQRQRPATVLGQRMVHLHDGEHTVTSRSPSFAVALRDPGSQCPC